MNFFTLQRGGSGVMGSGFGYLDFCSIMGPWHVSRGFIVRAPYTTSCSAETEGRRSFSKMPRRPFPVLPIGARGHRALWTQSPCFLFDDNPCAPGNPGRRDWASPDHSESRLSIYTLGELAPEPDRTSFSGRYKAVLVDADTYLLELNRYIHLNPVRSGIVRIPEDYPWSGHRAYLGLETIPWLTTEWV